MKLANPHWKSLITKLNFFKFLKIKKSIIFQKNLKNLQISKFLILFFLEKNKIKNFILFFWTYLLKWNVSILHKKTTFLQQLRTFNYFNWKFFPDLQSWRFLKKLFGFKKNKFFKNKLKKINFFFLKKFFFSNKKKIDKRHKYFLTRDAYFSQINLKGFNIFFFKKKILNILFKKIYYSNIYISSLFNKNFKTNFKTKQFKISNILSLKLSKIYQDNLLSIKLKKLKKKIYSLQIKADSLFKIFANEFFVPYENFFFWKNIIRFSTAKYLFLITTSLVNIKYNSIITFLIKKFNFLGLKHTNIKSILLNQNHILKNGFNFFNTSRLEKILFPLARFFNFYKISYLLSITFQYIDIFFLKKKNLPIFIKWFLNFFLMQNFNFRTRYFKNSLDSINDKLMTLVFYWILSEIFQLIFGFSPAKILFLNSKSWKNLFFSNFSSINFWNKNWELLNYYSRDFVDIKHKYIFSLFFIKNKFTHKISFYDYIYFLRFKKLSFELKDYKFKNKIIKININNFTTKNYFPLGFFRPLVMWRFFFMWVNTKINLLTWKLYFGKPKIIYDSYNDLQNKFWPEFFFFKTSFERILLYGFSFWNGFTSFNLNWNFTSTYKGNLSFKFKKKIPITIGKKMVKKEFFTTSYFSEMKKNSLFFSFFSFLNWAYLLQYLLQFGHTKSTYNTSYWDYLTMVYNERFILNILNIQLNLKWNLKIMFKMFFLGGFICLVGAFNILLDGLVGVYGSYAKQPYTRFIWVNGLFSNFDKIFKNIQTKIADAYASKITVTRKIVWKLIWLWFVLRGLIQNLSIDISFFPSLFWSSWVFLEASARFYPTITTSNTECFLPTVYLEYTTVANDYSLLSLSFYINLLIVIFKKTRIIRQSEFSIYPQKLLGMTFWHKILPFNINIKHFWLLRQVKIVLTFLRKSKFVFFEFDKFQLTQIFKYLFIFWRQSLNLHRLQNFWWFSFFKEKKNPIVKFF